jgi:pimeloyl-ACP methyl ester carboxylesterase
MIQVPLDYEHPDGEMIEVALSRVNASDPAKRIGVLLVNPGGPGLPGRFLAPRIRDDTAKGTSVYANPVTPEVIAHFDLIGFDPRGVGASRPVIGCAKVASYRTVDWTPDDDAEQAGLERAMRDFAADCEAKHGEFLKFVDSYSVARDMDQIRRALGEEKINYFGTSYGSVIGTAYADLFPERVRAMAMDSAIRPSVDGPAYMREFAQNWERAFDAYAATCDADPTCATKFPDGIAAAYDGAVAQLSAQPLIDTTSGEEMNESVLGILVSSVVGDAPGDNPLIDSLLDAVARGDGSRVGGSLDSIQGLAALGGALKCADLDFPESEVVYRDLLPQMIAESPRFGHAEAPFILPCAEWTSSPRKHPAPHARGAPAILVVGGTGDGVVPYQWSVDLASELASGVLLTRDAVGHIAFNQCVVDAVSAYLVDLDVPGEGTICAE